MDRIESQYGEVKAFAEGGTFRAKCDLYEVKATRRQASKYRLGFGLLRERERAEPDKAERIAREKAEAEANS